MKNSVVRIGVVGIHGFSRSHINSITQLEQQGKPVRLAACVAHARELDESYAAGLEARGVRLVPDLDALLSLRADIDVVTVPVGIHLHVPMASKALEAGYAVYLEKPLVGAVQDALRLKETAKRCRGPLFIGYQDCFQPAVRALKRDLLSGSLGRLKKVVVMAAWPRYKRYYERNNWAGKLRIGDTYALDCPVNNACAHYLNLALFWAGKTEKESARPASVTAELYRANPIESADTTCLRVATADGPEVVFAASHACRTVKGPLFRLECEKGFITTERSAGAFAPWTVHRPGRDPEPAGEGLPRVDAFEMVERNLHGDAEAPVCTFEIAFAQTVAVNGAFLSSPIHTIPDAECENVQPEPGEDLRLARSMNDVLDACLERGCLPSETGLAAWSRPGRPVDVSSLTRFDLP